jgi:hypothetical protein
MKRGRLLYKPLTVFTSKKEVLAALESGSMEERMVLPFAIGESFPGWKYA